MAQSSGVGGARSGSYESLDLGRRLAIERELEANEDSLALGNAVFDESGNFLVS